MYGKSDEEIDSAKQKAMRFARMEGYEVVNTIFKDARSLVYNIMITGENNPGMAYLAKSIAIMSTCDVVYFVNGWEYSRVCRCEYEIAKAYNMDIILEDKISIPDNT